MTIFEVSKLRQKNVPRVSVRRSIKPNDASSFFQSIYFLKRKSISEMNFIVFTLVLICAFAAFVSAGTYNGTVTGSNCGGNCPGGCDSCPCGTSTKYLDAASWCAKYSGWNQVCADGVKNLAE